MVWLGAFIWVLAHKEKDADITSETKSQPEQKGFRGFLLSTNGNGNPNENENENLNWLLVIDENRKP